MAQRAFRIDRVGDAAQDLVGTPVPTSLIEYESLPDGDGEARGLVAAILKIPQTSDRVAD